MPLNVNTMAGPRTLSDEEMRGMPPEFRHLGVYQAPQQPAAAPQPSPLVDAIQRGPTQPVGLPGMMARQGLPSFEDLYHKFDTQLRPCHYDLNTKEYVNDAPHYNALAQSLDAYQRLAGEAGKYELGAANTGLASERQAYEIGGRGVWDKTLQDLMAKGASEDEIARAHQMWGRFGVPPRVGGVAGGPPPTVASLAQPSSGGLIPSPSGGAPLPPGKVADIIKANPGAVDMNQAVSQIYSQLRPEQMLSQKASIVPALETAYGAGNLRDRATPSLVGKGVMGALLGIGGLNPFGLNQFASNNWYSPQGRENMSYNYQLPLSEAFNRGTASMPSRTSEENELIRAMLGINR